ncbi:uncharacterized protein LOC116662134 isoform X2 [Camelus ferus]|uniref:Uncharacterized protein LOC116662134 isoform X2 n=1 Tax=Camelus ferus TaxID=419612 RepID=A0A8B8SNA8_CAMFR|nr:uncharacterized protein LOC116662134 isoform X2 [Camelus ferus]
MDGETRRALASPCSSSIHLSPSTFCFRSYSSHLLPLPSSPSLDSPVYLTEPRAQSGSLALPRMPTFGCQLDRGPETPAPSQGSVPVAARLCRPVGLCLLPRVGGSGCVSGRLGALGKGVRVSQPARARVSECPAEGLAPAPSACATCTGAQATPVQGRARTCRGHGHHRPYRGPHLPPLAPAGLPSVCGRRPLPLSRRESPPPGLPLLGRRPRPAPGRPASRAGGICGAGRGRGQWLRLASERGCSPRPPPLSLPRHP